MFVKRPPANDESASDAKTIVEKILFIIKIFKKKFLFLLFVVCCTKVFKMCNEVKKKCDFNN